MIIFHEKSISYHFKIKKIIVFVLSKKKVILTVKHLIICVDENSKKLISDMKKTPKSRTNIKMSSKKNQKWFIIKIFDPICFMKILWLITAHWCFQKTIGFGMAFRWSDTLQCISTIITQMFSVSFFWQDLPDIYMLATWNLHVLLDIHGIYMIWKCNFYIKS